jgi:hypothetical protein
MAGIQVLTAVCILLPYHIQRFGRGGFLLREGGRMEPMGVLQNMKVLTRCAAMAVVEASAYAWAYEGVGREGGEDCLVAEGW